MKFEAVIFDYEGVLVEMDRGRAGSFFRGRSPISVKELTRRWEVWCAEHIGDCLSAYTMWRTLWNSLRLEFDIPGPVLTEILAFDYVGLLQVCPDALDALREAKKHGLRVGVLSNSSLPKLESPSCPLPLAQLVDVIRVPGRGVAVKPDHAAYLDMVLRLGTSPERCLFFDNDPSFVRAARDLGLRAFLVSRGAATAPDDPAVVRDLCGFRRLLEELD